MHLDLSFLRSKSVKNILAEKVKLGHMLMTLGQVTKRIRKNYQAYIVLSVQILNLWWK